MNEYSFGWVFISSHFGLSDSNVIVTMMVKTTTNIFVSWDTQENRKRYRCASYLFFQIDRTLRYITIFIKLENRKAIACLRKKLLIQNKSLLFVEHSFNWCISRKWRKRNLIGKEIFYIFYTICTWEHQNEFFGSTKISKSG